MTRDDLWGDKPEMRPQGTGLQERGRKDKKEGQSGGRGKLMTLDNGGVAGHRFAGERC